MIGVFIIVLLGSILGVCLHEFGHALVAYKGGDYTVKQKGYLSFNPLKYTDPMMSIIIPMAFLIMGGFALPGGAVYIEYWRLKSKNWISYVALAGPFFSLLGAVLYASPFILGLVDLNNPSPLALALAFLTFVQVISFCLNLLPAPPLDGYRALSVFLSFEQQYKLDRAGLWGILIIFMMFRFVEPFRNFFFSLVFLISSFLNVPVDAILSGMDLFFFWK